MMFEDGYAEDHEAALTSVKTASLGNFQLLSIL